MNLLIYYRDSLYKVCYWEHGGANPFVTTISTYINCYHKAWSMDRIERIDKID